MDTICQPTKVVDIPVKYHDPNPKPFKMPTVPFYDFEELDQTKVVEALIKELAQVGICQLSSIPKYNEDEFLEALKAFFAIPEDIKMKLALKHFRDSNPNVYRGYFPF